MYQCSTHAWVSMYTACPQCQPHIVSTATTNTEPHTKHTTGEQPGMDKYSEGFIYINYHTSGISHSCDSKVEVIGPHPFKDGEDVTGRYELGYQVDISAGRGDWKDIDNDWYTRCEEEYRRIVAIPLPSKGQEGGAERRAWELVDKFNKDKIVCIDYCNKMIDVESSYIETPYGVDQIRFWQQVRNSIVNL